MSVHSMLFSIFLIFAGASILATFALVAKQSLLVGYILLGVLLGPWGFKLVHDSQFIQRTGDIGIIFLLFLLGLHLPPKKLVHMLRKITLLGIVSSLIFLACGYVIGLLFGFNQLDCLIIGMAMMFSSTIIGIKLLPTTILHHQHTGEVMISVLLLQDILAIGVLLFMHAMSGRGGLWYDIGLIVIGFPAVVVFALLFERFVLTRLCRKFSRIKEYIFLLAIAWCLAMAVLAGISGLSNEIGAFIAGVSLASSPISLYIAESLKPLRDFFLVMFFFSVGASFNLHYFDQVIIPALILMLALFLIKPFTYRFLLERVKEQKHVAWEVGVRLAQISEFSLIIAYVGMDTHLITPQAAYLIEAATILSFMLSSYFVVLKYPTPVALSDRLRRD